MRQVYEKLASGDKQAKPLVRIEKKRVIESEEERQTLTDIYCKNFEEINKECFCKQSYDPEELGQVLVDQDILKLILYDSSNSILGFSLVTNNLNKVPWISIPFCKTHFPNHFSEKKIYYIKTLVVNYRQRSFRNAKKLLIAIMKVFPKDALAAFDCSERTNRLIPELARRSTPMEPINGGPVDRQEYYVFHWPPS